MAQGSPRTEDRRTQRQTDGWRRLPISDRATLNGIYLDPDVGIESEPKKSVYERKPKQLCVIEL